MSGEPAGNGNRSLEAGGQHHRATTGGNSYTSLWGHIDRLSQGRTAYRFRRWTVYRKKEGDYLATVSAVDTIAAKPVICFGGGATVEEALRQVNRAVAESRWRDDKYAGTNWAT